MGNSDYRTTRRVLELVRLAEAGTELTVKKVQAHAQVERAAATRYLKLIDEFLGTASRVRGGRKVVTRAPSGGEPADQVVALELAARSLEWLRRTSYGRELRKLIAAHRGQLTTEQQDQIDRLLLSIHFKDRQRSLPTDSGETTARILASMRLRRRCSISYRKLDGSTNTYVVEPWALAIIGNSPFLIAGKLPDLASRSFALCDIQTVEPEDVAFTSPSPDDANPAVLLRDTIGSYASSFGKREQIVLKARGSAVILLERLPLHPTQAVEKDASGRATVRLNAVICPDLVSAVLSLLPDVKVIGPEALCRQVQQALEQAGSGWDP